MLEKIVNRIAALLSIKSIVTLALTAVFAYLSITGVIDGKEFMTIFSVVIAFYFGTQHEKKSVEIVNGDGK